MLNGAIRNIWPMLTIFLVVIISIRLMHIHNSSEHFVFYKEFFNIVFVIYALLLFELLTSTELNVNSGFNLIPFTEITRYKIGTHGFYMNVIGNILIFFTMIKIVLQEYWNKIKMKSRILHKTGNKDV